MTTAVTMLIAAAGATSSGARISAKAGRTAQPMSGPIHGMNTISPAMTAMSAAYGIPSTTARDADDDAVDRADEQPAADEAAERDRDRRSSSVRSR